MEQTNEPIIKKERKQMARRAPWRWNEDGTYNHKPNSESYFRDYYRKNASHRVNCTFCNKYVVVHDIKRHQKTKKCLLVQSSLTLESANLASSTSSGSGSENC